MPKHVLVLNGPNLNWLGRRNPKVYGSQSYDRLCESIRKLATKLGVDVSIRQSNHEGQLIDWIQEHADSVDGVLLNAGGLTHTSVSLRDAVEAISIPVLEIHLSNVHAREEFRRNSLLSSVVSGQVTGLGFDSYLLGLRGLLGLISDE